MNCIPTSSYVATVATGGYFLGGRRKPNFPDKLYDIMFKIDYPWNYLLSSTSTMSCIIFHKRGRVFYQGYKHERTIKITKP